MEITIKSADSPDMEELLRWREIVLREVFSIPMEENMDDLIAANRQYYLTALEKREHIACFAQTEGKTVGCGGVCLYQEIPSPDNPNGRCAYLMNIYTIPAMRRHGIGKAVVEWLLQEAKDRGAGKIYLEASESAYPLYRELGFCEMDGYLKYTKEDSFISGGA
ncbi:MAG: GNAT family N-acetyltransferase [Lachnospiraceae bacterium]|nr:GNAT family N-acetyltransferase [Lachnospiraceae bacterium]